MDADVAQSVFEEFKEKWGKQYPKKVKAWEEHLPTLLTFYKRLNEKWCGRAIRGVVYPDMKAAFENMYRERYGEGSSEDL